MMMNEIEDFKTTEHRSGIQKDKWYPVLVDLSVADQTKSGDILAVAINGYERKSTAENAIYHSHPELNAVARGSSLISFGICEGE